MSAPLIGILNVEIGNLRSVSNAVYSQGWEFRLVSDPDGFDDLTHLIVPGVGSFHRAAIRLKDRGLVEPVRSFAASGRPTLGICLGMQLLGTGSEEGAASGLHTAGVEEARGLDLIPGRVVRLRSDLVPSIPHVGWNSLELRYMHPVTEGVRGGADYYFVHSYVLCPDAAGDVLGSTECGQEFTSAVARGNVIGFQFHPEKSQANGLRLLDNFCMWDGTC